MYLSFQLMLYKGNKIKLNQDVVLGLHKSEKDT